MQWKNVFVLSLLCGFSAVASQRKAVIFDLDDTLFDTNYRTLKILHEVAHERNGLDQGTRKKLTSLTYPKVHFYCSQTLKNVGITQSDTVEKICGNPKQGTMEKSLWGLKFFDGAYLKDDGDVPGAHDFVSRVAKEKGAKILYLTARSEQTQGAATKEELKSHKYVGFVPGEAADSAQLFLKSDASLSDVAYKQGVTRELAKEYQILGVFDDSADNVNMFVDTLDASVPVIRLQRLSKNAQDRTGLKPNSRAVQIVDFTEDAMALLASDQASNNGGTHDGALAANERLVTILATNDIHGGIEPSKDKAGKLFGGMAAWSGVVGATRQGLGHQYGKDRAGVLLVDAGDQFQGTLISNYNEGALTIGLMKKIGYDAIVPGNHDYDFGPKGWLVDQSTDPTKRREVLEGLITQLGAPLLAANDFYRTYQGATVTSECKPDAHTTGEWKPVRPPFVQPYKIVNVAGGVRVALIGLDNAKTAAMTTADNVADLCFADELATYRDLRHALEGQADVFVLVLHDGDAKNDHNVTKLTEAIQADESIRLDAVVSAHTHYTYNETKGGVPMIQSGANGGAYGRIDLVWDVEAKKVVRRSSAAGVRMYTDECDRNAQAFCKVTGGKVLVEGVEVKADPDIEATVKTERAKLDRTIAKTKLGESEAELASDRIKESPLMDFFTDALLAAANRYLDQHPQANVKHVDVAFYNSGGLRSALPKGTVTYEDLFRSLPFNNHGFTVGPMSTEKILELLKTSIRTCGYYGAILPSGLRVRFTRDCSQADKPTDSKAALVSVETVDGKKLYPGKPDVDSLVVTTVDFLTQGGEGGAAFKDVPLLFDVGIAREVISDLFKEKPFHTPGTTDGRWQESLPTQN